MNPLAPEALRVKIPVGDGTERQHGRKQAKRDDELSEGL
jgi:hypothetical protein